MKLAARLAGLATAVTLVVAGGSLSATASGSPGWRIVSTIGQPNGAVDSGSLLVTGPGNAWTTWTCGPCSSASQFNQTLMYRWNGRRWGSVDLPPALNAPRSIAGMGASSATNLWVFTDNGRQLVWNGSHWTVKKLPAWVLRPVHVGVMRADLVVFSPGDVWAFSIGSYIDPSLAGHYFNGAWHKVFLPFLANHVVGIRPDDVWATGLAKHGPSLRPPILAHWNGSAWRVLSLPRSVVEAGNLVPLGPRSAALVGEVPDPASKSVRFELLRQNGRWTVTRIPASVGAPTGLASDGNGGFWLTASPLDSRGARQSYFAQFAGEHWHTQLVPTEGKLSSGLVTLALIPGSQSLWATGRLFNPVANTSQGDILRFGP